MKKKSWRRSGLARRTTMPTGDRYVEVPAATLEAFLQAKGFTRTVRRSEVVYVMRNQRDTRYVVSVFTSIRDGATTARGLGQDAIKVSAFMFLDEAADRTRGIAKCQRVFRTGSVDKILERLYERMREAYRVTNVRIREDQERRAGVRR